MASTTRITGMYSGLDTEALVEEMINANKTPLNNYTREKTEIEWQRETLIEVNSQLLEFQNMAENMQKDSNFKVFTAETTDSRIATATATTDALEGTYRLSIEQLASATTLTSKPISGNERVGTIKTDPDNLVAWDTDFNGKSFSMTVNGVTKKISFAAGEVDFSDKNEANIKKAFQKKIDDAFGANQVEVAISDSHPRRGFALEFSCAPNALQVGIQVKSAEEDDMLSLLNIESGSSNVFNISQTIKDFTGTSAATLTYVINGKTETISTQTTLTDFFKKISNEDNDISIKYDSLSDAIIMRRESTGAGRDIEISDNIGLFSRLGLKEGSKYAQGQNAIVTITDPEGRTIGEITTDENGNKIGGLELTSNSFTYEGVNFNLTKAVPGEEVSITIAKDVDTVFDNVVKFVDKYNEILGKLNELTNEKPNKDYDPLLDEEREGLSDTQQEKWDKLARQGLLYRDSTLQSAITSMRNAVTSSLSTNDSIKSLFQIGISTTEYNATGNNNGKLIIDEVKLKEAITNNMDEVSALFTNKPDYISGTALDKNTTITEGSSFKITVNGKEQTITFDKDYDLSNESQKNEMISKINSILSSRFGGKNIVFAISDNRMLVTSQKGSSITLNSGDGNDALALLGLEDGATYDAKALGFANRIYNIMDTVKEEIGEKAGSNATVVDESTLGERMKELNKYISRQKDKLATLEDRYYAQFAAMENALAQLESQSSYIASMLGGGSGM